MTLGGLVKTKIRSVEPELHLGNEMFHGKVLDISAKYNLKAAIVEAKSEA